MTQTRAAQFEENVIAIFLILTCDSDLKNYFPGLLCFLAGLYNLAKCYDYISVWLYNNNNNNNNSY